MSDFDFTTVAFCDTETLGLDPERHPIWEVAVIVDGREYVWQQKVTHDDIARAEPIALEKNGFHERYGKGIFKMLSPVDSMDAFGIWTRGRHIVGACPWFDAERMHRKQLQSAYTDAQRIHPWHHRHYDIESMVFGRTGKECKGLKHACNILGITYEEHSLHSALYDAQLAKQCFEVMVS